MARTRYSGPIQSAAGFELSEGVYVPGRVVPVFNTPVGAATADFDGLFFIADAAYDVVTVVARYAVATASATTLMLKKVPSGTAKASGTDCLSAGIPMNSTADTNLNGTLHGTPTNYRLAAGDALGLVLSGASTSLDGVTVRVELKRVDNLLPERVVAAFNTPAGATATDFDGLFFVADAGYQVTAVRERHAVAGADAGAVTLMLKKVASGTAKASGTDMLSAGINMKATADTNQLGALSATPANTRLAAGDSMGVVPTGTLTSLDGVTLTVEMQRVA